MAAGAGIVVVFDFDKTIIDVDSDNWVVDSLGYTDLFERLLPTMPWNALMDTMMGALHAGGKTLADVAEALRAAPIDPRVPAAVTAAYALGCDLRVLSDANAFFIETVLEHHGIRGCFSEINTNPSHVDADGRLRIGPYHDAPHGCGVGTCPPNMCKGQVMDRILRECASAADGRRTKRVVYLGDGRGDYCPALRLAREDFVMPRRGYPVWDLICEDPARVQAEVHPWADGAELEETLLRLVGRALVEEAEAEAAMLPPLDCKLESSMPVAAQDGGMPIMPLGVKN